MKKIKTTPYQFVVNSSDGKPTTQDFNVKEALINILLHPELKLNGRDLLLAHKFAEKIENCQDDFILVDLTDYVRLTKAIETLQGFNKVHVEFVKRIVDAEDVDVQEKKQ